MAELIRQQRRLALEARTIGVTLASALRGVDASVGYVSSEERRRLRAQVYDRVRLLSQAVRVRAARAERLGGAASNIPAGPDADDRSPLGRATHEAELMLRDLEQAIERLAAEVEKDDPGQGVG